MARDKVDLLKEKDRIISQLHHELIETNQGVLLLIAELEQESDKKFHAVQGTVTQLHQELLATDRGLLALTAELELTKEKYRNILENAREAIFTFNERLEIKTCNTSAVKLFGYTGEEMLAMTMTQLIADFDRYGPVSAHDAGDPGSCFKKTSASGITLYGKDKNRRFFPVEMTTGTPFYHEQVIWMAIVKDITERKKAEENLRLMAKVFESTSDAMIIMDIAGTVVDVNDSFVLITGYSREDVVGRNPEFAGLSCLRQSDGCDSLLATLKSAGKWEGEVWDKKKNGELYVKWLSICSVRDEGGEASHYLYMFTDITVRKEAEKKLVQLAHYDPLTGLPNRALFLEKFQWAVELTARNDRHVGLVFIDLDRFKAINDTLGHQAGDQLLIEVARRLKAFTRKTDTVCRLAGDEFIMVISDLHDPKYLEVISRKILQAFAKPFMLAEREYAITCSIGIAIYPDDGRDLQQLIKSADTAMYYAKAQGKNTFAFYSENMADYAHDDLELGANLRKALHSNEFRLFYQAQMDLKTRDIVGVEVLIRWPHPELGFVPPNIFIPFAEQTDLIVKIGNWVLKAACNQFVQWRKAGLPPLKISVNYSGVQLKQSNQVAVLEAILKETGMDPNYLCLELTESVAMENAESTINALRAIKRLGISVSIDDFGTGYSSLSYLRRFPIDVLKIDRSFVSDIPEDSDSAAIATAIIAMAHRLRLSVVAEGVETEDQLLFLSAEDCDHIQGYYFSRPLAHDELVRFIERYNRSKPAERRL